MAASYTPVSPKIDWSNHKNLAEEFLNFQEMCAMMWLGPLKATEESERFGYIKLWSAPKSIALWKNSGNTDIKVDSLMSVLQNHSIPTDRRFWAARMEMRNLSQRANETVQDYATRVISVAETCKWSNEMNK